VRPSLNLIGVQSIHAYPVQRRHGPLKGEGGSIGGIFIQ